MASPSLIWKRGWVKTLEFLGHSASLPALVSSETWGRQPGPPWVGKVRRPAASLHPMCLEPGAVLSSDTQPFVFLPTICELGVMATISCGETEAGDIGD